MSDLARRSQVRPELGRVPPLVGPGPVVRPLVVRVCGAVVTAALLAACSAGSHGASPVATSASSGPRETSGATASSDPTGPDGSAGRSGSPLQAAARDIPGAAVLRAWDDARARAFADGDPSALRRLYVTGSRAGRADVALLRAYLSRGLRVEGLRMQVLVLEVLHQDRRHLRLRVTDRVSGGVVVGGGSQVALPRDQASTRVVELRSSDDGRWRVVTVSESGRRPAAR